MKFKKELFIKDMEVEETDEFKLWVSRCDGQEVEPHPEFEGHYRIHYKDNTYFHIHKNWCE